jgi:hypothetical protein
MKKLTFIIGLFMLLMACHKYENGPFISFRSVKKRVIGNWKLKEYKIGDVDRTDSISAGEEIWWRFKEDYTLERDFNYGKTITGEWELDSDHNVIVTLKMPLTADGQYYYEKDTLNFTRLTNKEMWVEHAGRIVEKYEAQ